MAFKIRCRFCKDEHKHTTKNFPLTIHGEVEAFEGKGKNRKSLGLKQQVIGYACEKCVNKYHWAEFIKEHRLKPSPGQKMIQAIRAKIEELKQGVRVKAMGV